MTCVLKVKGLPSTKQNHADAGRLMIIVYCGEDDVEDTGEGQEKEQEQE